jgi:putative transposase
VIQGTAYKFCFSRSIEGDVKTVTVKRVGYLWICFSVMEEISDPVGASTGNIGGFDFGLQSSLTDQEGTVYHGPQFLKAELTEIARLNKAVSRKQKGSTIAGMAIGSWPVTWANVSISSAWRRWT